MIRLAGPAALAAMLLAAALPAEVPAATDAAFSRYLEAADVYRLAQLRDSEAFLDFSGVDDNAMRAHARSGGVAMRELMPPGAGDAAAPPDALVHHWIGTTFIAGATLEQVLAIVRDIESYPQLFGPEVEAAAILERRSDDEALVYMRFRKTKVITTVIDTEQIVRFVRPAPDRAYSLAEATLVRDVDNAGDVDERRREDGGGLLWRLFASWRYLEADGGVWVENESIMLTRRPGFPLSLVMQPMLHAGPREGVEFALRKLEEKLRR